MQNGLKQGNTVILRPNTSSVVVLRCAQLLFFNIIA